jgi:hypothetical protein
MDRDVTLESQSVSHAMRRPVHFALALCLICAFCANGVAQASSSSGAIDGWVLDASAGPVSGASVTARNQQTHLTRGTTTSDTGYFRIPELPIGLYTVVISAPGFAPFEHHDIEVSVGLTVRAGASLKLAGQSQQITVHEVSPLIDPSQTSMTTAVGRERIEESPVRTRNALDFVLMEPNVVSTRAGANSGATPGGLAGSGFSFGGMRPTSNRIAIDGMENDDAFSGGSRTELSPEIVEEFQVVNNGISAASGGASGGSVNIVTRSGASAMHGDAFLFLQNGSLDARPPIEDVQTAPDLNRYRAGFSNGAALIPNRTFYYVAFEQEHERSQAAGDIAPAIAALLNNTLAAGLYPGFPVRSLIPGFSPTARAETEASAKLDQQQSERSLLSFRYALTNNREAGDAYNGGGLQDPSARGSSFLFDQSATASWTFTASPTAVNELRAQVSRRDALLRPNQGSGPEMIVNGLADFGQPYFGNESYIDSHADLSDTFSWNHGRHLIQAGGATTYIHDSVTNFNGEGGVFVFSNLSSFLSGRPSIYRQMFGNPSASLTAPSYGGFVQDHWVANPHFTIDTGLRYDFEQLPAGFNESTHNFSPRLGLAYSPANCLVLRAGYGIFFDRYLLSAFDRTLAGNGVLGFEQVAEGPRTAAILASTLGASPLSPPPGLLPSIYRADPALATPYSQQSSLGLQYALAKDATLSANYLWVRGDHLPRTRNIDAPPYDSFPAYNALYQLEDTANSTYNGLSLALRVMKEDFTLDTSYTLSKVTDDASTWMEQPQNPYAIWQDLGPALFDQRQRFVLSGLFDLPIGDQEGAPHTHHSFLLNLFSNLELAPIFTAESGLPVNPLTGLDTTATLSWPLSARPAGMTRDSLRLPPLVSLDLRLLKAIPMSGVRHLDLVAESFNLLNHTNITALNPFFGPAAVAMPSFAAPVDALQGRQLQFSIDFEY